MTNRIHVIALDGGFVQRPHCTAFAVHRVSWFNWTEEAMRYVGFAWVWPLEDARRHGYVGR